MSKNVFRMFLPALLVSALMLTACGGKKTETQATEPPAPTVTTEPTSEPEVEDFSLVLIGYEGDNALLQRKGEMPSIELPMQVLPGDSFDSGSGSATLCLDGERYIILDPGTKIGVSGSGKDFCLWLDRGRITNIVNNGIGDLDAYCIETSDAHTHVKGTIFCVDFNELSGDKLTEITTLDGTVAVTVGKDEKNPITVPAGKTTQVKNHADELSVSEVTDIDFTRYALDWLKAIVARSTSSNSWFATAEAQINAKAEAEEAAAKAEAEKQKQQTAQQNQSQSNNNQQQNQNSNQNNQNQNNNQQPSQDQNQNQNTNTAPMTSDEMRSACLGAAQNLCNSASALGYSNSGVNVYEEDMYTDRCCIEWSTVFTKGDISVDMRRCVTIFNGNNKQYNNGGIWWYMYQNGTLIAETGGSDDGDDMIAVMSAH